MQKQRIERKRSTLQKILKKLLTNNKKHDIINTSNKERVLISMTTTEMIKAFEKAFENMPQNVEVSARTKIEFNAIEDAWVMHIEIAFPAKHTHE